ncbi:2-phospho-L-lactate guanylyltransferase [Sphingomonas cavernae]|uniref:3-phospho-D-glycerate guanylyltransferase n=1 Tax=Sphingomonas cavernae TaxID=2320861 RepID=A0A418WMQ1_9SPHN|nr:2-phospho-L-lactate guanylyltransferase [Sphingomonas cavernae]RJF91276.1 2-phospho-L-lactate guanylyltransferase [Sphingomonas cavernae]
MTGWRAIIPLNLGRERKTRLAGRLSASEREHLVEAMALHVINQLRAAPSVAEVRVLSPAKPGFSGVQWLKDTGDGLNQELARVLGGERVLVIHADLPLLAANEVEALLREAVDAGAAIAPDRLGTGTNALALTQATSFVPAFGEGSFARHRALLPNAALVERPGLQIDVDTPEDLELALKSGATSIACPI